MTDDVEGEKGGRVASAAAPFALSTRWARRHRHWRWRWAWLGDLSGLAAAGAAVAVAGRTKEKLDRVAAEIVAEAVAPSRSRSISPTGNPSRP